MNARWIAILAAGLVAVGAIGDRVVSQNVGQSAAAAAKSAPPVATKPQTVLLSQPAAPAQATNVSASSIDQTLEHAYATASASVVYIANLGVGSGSGIIYDSQGDIVTNDHVVSGASTLPMSLNVTLNNGKQYAAQLVGTDPADDLAVIRIHASGLQPAHFAAAGDFQVAQMVLAIGSPLGLKQSVTSGIISGLERVEQEPNGAYLPNAIQTSAPINPGNSGGALVTLNGVVVGMPTLEQTSTHNGVSAQNIGFAIPSTRITSVANQLIATGKVEHTGRPYLGISPGDPSGQQGSLFGGAYGGGFGQSNPTVAGAVVEQVASGGPAAQAGVQQGDTITAVGGTPITDAQDLLTILAQKKPGDRISLKLNRGGSALSVQVRLGELPG